MKQSTRSIATAANNPWFMVVGGFCSIVGFIAYLYEKLDPKFELLTKGFFGLGIAVLFFGYYYSVLVRRENIALRSLSRLFYEINEIYRNKLQVSFFGENPITNASDLLDAEKIALSSVCQRIENIFSTSTNRQCLATVKLVTKSNGQGLAQTYVRSQESCARDNPNRIQFKVGTGENTAFDQALMPNADGRPAHFYSADLTKHSNYSNQRQHYQSYYKSTLVVPIRGERTHHNGQPVEYDLVGFLCVDTLSTNRLNNGYQLFMLAALAQQMYNFMSLMRGRYTVFVDA